MLAVPVWLPFITPSYFVLRQIYFLIMQKVDKQKIRAELFVITLSFSDRLAINRLYTVALVAHNLVICQLAMQCINWILMHFH